MKCELSKSLGWKKQFVFLSITACFWACFTSFVQVAYSDESASTQTTSSRRTPTTIALEDAKKSVVNIEGDRIEPQNFNDPSDIGKAYNGMGTGIIFDSRGYIVTNFHVIDGLRKIKVSTVDKKEYIGVAIARDPVTDLAIIKINATEPLTAIKIGRSADIIWAETVYVIGNPYGYPWSITDGVVSGLNRDVPVNNKLMYPSAIQTSAPINPGNSGGPLLNADGEMIGIATAIRQGAECIAFAIPSDQATEVAARLIQNETNRISYHGINLKTNADNPSEVFVESVEPGSPAEKAGVRPDDKIVSSEKINIHTKLDFSRSLLDLKASDTLQLSLVRQGESIDSSFALAGPRRASGTKIGGVYAVKQQSSPRYGSAIDQKTEDLTWEILGIRYTTIPLAQYKRQYAQYLKLYPDGAILVTDVRPGSPMFNAEIEKGDVIFGIHEWVASSEEDVNLIIAQLQENKSKLKRVQVYLNGTRDNNPPNSHYKTQIELWQEK